MTNSLKSSTLDHQTLVKGFGVRSNTRFNRMILSSILGTSVLVTTQNTTPTIFKLWNVIAKYLSKGTTTKNPTNGTWSMDGTSYAKRFLTGTTVLKFSSRMSRLHAPTTTTFVYTDTSTTLTTVNTNRISRLSTTNPTTNSSL